MIKKSFSLVSWKIKQKRQVFATVTRNFISISYKLNLIINVK